MPEITVSPAGQGAFDVRVQAGGERHTYRVRVPDELAARLAAEPPAVARATIAFLLDREPPGSVLASFDCSVVPSYFPEYEAELPRYLEGPGPGGRHGRA